VWLALLFLLFPVLASSQPVKSLPKPTDYVSDFAHVLSPATIQQLGLVCGQVDHEAHAQIAVVTVSTLGDQPVEDYAVQLYQAWGLGAKGGPDQDRGVLILIAVNDRKRFISTGFGLEGILPDSLVGRIGRDMVPMLRANDFDGAMTLAVGQISQIIAADAGVKLAPLPGQGTLESRQQQQPMHISLGQMIFFGIAILVILFLLGRFGGSGLIWFLLGMFFGGGRGGGGGFGGGGGGGGDGFGGFGGGSTGGGGAGGSW
jgi:uncharacterized protein